MITNPFRERMKMLLLKHKILFIVVFPMFLLAAYQFYSVDHAFNAIDEVRSKVFVESAKEVKYANDVQFLTSLLSSTLFEMDSTFESSDTEAFDHSLRLYRETQQQRYFSLQKLKETLSGEAAQSDFQFITILDENNLGEIIEIEKKISQLDQLNEKIVSILMSARDTNGIGFARYPLIEQSNTLTREIVGELAGFVNKRYIKVDETSKLVAVSEMDARNTLLMICLLGYFLAALMVIFFYQLVILPLERFSRSIDKGSMENIAWTALEPYRNDEIGVVYRALEKMLKLPRHREVKADKTKSKKEKKSRQRSTDGKNRARK